MNAIIYNSLDTVKLLLARIADVNKIDIHGNNDFMYVIVTNVEVS